MPKASKPAAPSPARPPDTLLQSIIADLPNDSAAFAPDGPCPTLLEPGHPRIAIISGQNAGGKSLLARVIGARLHEHKQPKIEVMLISMNLRIQPGMERAFIFGEDKSSSTGNISVRTALAGIRNSRAREHPHILMLDEPDIGLAEGMQAALGEELAAYAADLPSSAVGFLLVTHSRPLIRQFLPLAPTFVRVGDDLRPTAKWLDVGDLPTSRADLENLGKRAHARYLDVAQLLRSK